MQDLWRRLINIDVKQYIGVLVYEAIKARKTSARPDSSTSQTGLIQKHSSRPDTCQALLSLRAVSPREV